MSISEAYDSRVAYPLIIIAVLSLLFVDMNGHKVLPLKNTSNTTGTKKLVSQQSDQQVTSAPNLPSLSNTVKTEDLYPGESPLDIKTASPQSSSTGNGSASNSSGKQLQNTPDSSPGNSGQPSLIDTENIVNGVSNQLINIDSSVSNGVKSVLSH